MVGVEPSDVDILCVDRRSVCYPISMRRMSGDDDNDPVVVKFEMKVVAETVSAAQQAAADNEEADTAEADDETFTVDAVSLRTAIIAAIGSAVAGVGPAV